MSKFQVSLIDADKTMFVRNSMWEHLDGDNRNALTPEFLSMLRHLAPTPWFVKNRATWHGNVNIVVTGRLPEHEKVTMERVHELFCEVDSLKKKWSFVSVKWNDKLPTNFESYLDYVDRKYRKLYQIARIWIEACSMSNIDLEIHVYEDDKNVLDLLVDLAIIADRLKLFIMNEDGTKATPYNKCPGK